MYVFQPIHRFLQVQKNQDKVKEEHRPIQSPLRTPAPIRERIGTVGVRSKFLGGGEGVVDGERVAVKDA